MDVVFCIRTNNIVEWILCGVEEKEDNQGDFNIFGLNKLKNENIVN